jgi:hypothetical protein
LIAADQFVANLFVYASGYEDFTGIGKPFKARRYVHAIALYILALDDNIAQVDSDPKPNPIAFRYLEVSGYHTLLYDNCTANGFNWAVKHRKEAIATGTYQVSPMFNDRRIDKFCEQSFDTFYGPPFVGAH